MKFEYTPDEIKQGLQVYDGIKSVCNDLTPDVIDYIEVFEKDGVDYVSFTERDSWSSNVSFPLNLLYLNNTIAIKDYLVEKERLRKEAEALENLRHIQQHEALREQKEYETYLKLKEKYGKLS